MSGLLISDEQSTSMGGKNILDGPLILNQVITWAKGCKLKSVLFEIDFAIKCDWFAKLDLSQNSDEPSELYVWMERVH